MHLDTLKKLATCIEVWNATTCFYFQQEVLVLDEADRLLDMGFEARYTRKPLLCTTGIILKIFDKQ